MSDFPSSVLLAGGGTAGHVSPLLALAEALRRRDPDIRITVLGTRAGLEARIVPERGLPLRFVPRVPLPRKPSADLLRLPGRLRSAVRAARAAIDESGAEVVVGFGGYVSTPAYLAARGRVPIVIHEQNTTAGLANKLGARFTTHVATTFEDTSLRHATRIGMPLRTQITTLDVPATRAEARARFGLEPDRPTVLVTGGSLGAQRLNEAFAASATDLSLAGVQVLHVTGRGKEFLPQETDDGARYVVVPYADAMEFAYAAADLVVARSGASTVCELTAVGLPAVFVPLPIGNGEQRRNAAEDVRVGGALLVEDAQLTPQWIAEHVIPLARDRVRLGEMGRAAASIGEREADERLADMVGEAFRDGRSRVADVADERGDGRTAPGAGETLAPVPDPSAPPLDASNPAFDPDALGTERSSADPQTPAVEPERADTDPERPV